MWRFYLWFIVRFLKERKKTYVLELFFKIYFSRQFLYFLKIYRNTEKNFRYLQEYWFLWKKKIRHMYINYSIHQWQHLISFISNERSYNYIFIYYIYKLIIVEKVNELLYAMYYLFIDSYIFKNWFTFPKKKKNKTFDFYYYKTRT